MTDKIKNVQIANIQTDCQLEFSETLVSMFLFVWNFEITNKISKTSTIVKIKFSF